MFRSNVDDKAAAVAETAVRELRHRLPPEPELQVATLQPADDETTDAEVLVAYAGSILLLMSLAVYGQWVVTGVVEERSNRVVEGLGRSLEGGGEPGRRGGDDGDTVRLPLREGALERDGTAYEREQDDRGGEEDLAAQPLADLALGDEPDRARAGHRSTSSRKSSDSEGGP